MTASFAEFWVDVGRNGAGNEDRTRDLKITNLALYRLSYPGLAPLYWTVRTGSSKPHTARSPFRRLLPFGLDEFCDVPLGSHGEEVR